MGQLKTVHVDLKNKSDVVDNEAVQSTKFNTQETKLNNFKNKIPDATTLIRRNQYNTHQQTLEKQKIGDVNKKMSSICRILTATVSITKISEVENKMHNTSSLVNCSST